MRKIKKIAAADELEILRFKSAMSSSSKPNVQMLLMVLPRGGEQKTLGVRVGAGRLGTHLKKRRPVCYTVKAKFI